MGGKILVAVFRGSSSLTRDGTWAILRVQNLSHWATMEILVLPLTQISVIYSEIIWALPGPMEMD